MIPLVRKDLGALVFFSKILMLLTVSIEKSEYKHPVVDEFTRLCLIFAYIFLNPVPHEFTLQ